MCLEFTSSIVTEFIFTSKFINVCCLYYNEKIIKKMQKLRVKMATNRHNHKCRATRPKNYVKLYFEIKHIYYMILLCIKNKVWVGLVWQ